MTSDDTPTHALTLDIEEWFHGSTVDLGGPGNWESLESRVRHQTDQLLEVLERHDVRATCFVVGWVAEHHPDVVARIADAGHDIGCHSHTHDLVYELGPEAFADDLARSIAAIEEAAGVDVRSYRAPSFSVTDETPWFFDILAEHGIAIDSSVCPGIRHDAGHSEFSLSPQHVETESGSLVEIPVSTFELGPLAVGSVGGGYFRLVPNTMCRWYLEHLEARDQRGVFYLHPHDIDPDQPRLDLSPVDYFRKYVGLESGLERFEALVDNVSFGPLTESHEEAIDIRRA